MKIKKIEKILDEKCEKQIEQGRLWLFGCEDVDESSWDFVRGVWIKVFYKRYKGKSAAYPICCPMEEIVNDV